MGSKSGYGNRNALDGSHFTKKIHGWKSHVTTPVSWKALRVTPHDVTTFETPRTRGVFRLWNRSRNVRPWHFPISRRPVPDGIVWYCRAEFPVNPKKKARSEYLHDLHSHGVEQKISSTAVQVQEIRKGEKQLFWVCIPLGFQHTQLNKGVALVQYPPPPQKKKTSCSTSLGYSSFQGKLPRKKIFPPQFLSPRSQAVRASFKVVMLGCKALERNIDFNKVKASWDKPPGPMASHEFFRETPQPLRGLRKPTMGKLHHLVIWDDPPSRKDARTLKLTTFWSTCQVLRRERKLSSSFNHQFSGAKMLVFREGKNLGLKKLRKDFRWWYEVGWFMFNLFFARFPGKDSLWTSKKHLLYNEIWWKKYRIFTLATGGQFLPSTVCKTKGWLILSHW